MEALETTAGHRRSSMRTHNYRVLDLTCPADRCGNGDGIYLQPDGTMSCEHCGSSWHDSRLYRYAPVIEAK
ncbi:hypothetical protein BH686_16805 [Rhodococcus erythropolis]|nr:hypothetical protein BH686_16805 [Rhodococcus erythropolis]